MSFVIKFLLPGTFHVLNSIHQAKQLRNPCFELFPVGNRAGELQPTYCPCRASHHAWVLSYTLAWWRWSCTWLSPSRPSSWSTTWQYNDIHLRGWDTTDLPDCQEDPHGGPAEDVAHVHDGDNGDEPGHDVNTGHDTILALSEMCDSWGDGVSRPTEAVYRCTVSAMRLYSDTEANTDHVHHASSKWQHWHYRSETKYWCINPFKMYSLSSSINPRCSGYKLF